MKNTLLLFDIDGTLLSGNGTGRQAMTRAFERVFGIANAIAPVYMAGGMDLQFIEAAFQAHQIETTRVEEYLQAYYEELQATARDGEMGLLPGVRELLDEVERDYPNLHLAVGTGNVEVGARIKLDAFDLNPYFPVGGFCERPVPRHVVLQNGVESASAFYGVDFQPQDVVVIGDTLRDIEAARKMGARVVAVATGGNTYDELREADPDMLLEDLQESDRFLEYVAMNS